MRSTHGQQGKLLEGLGKKGDEPLQLWFPYTTRPLQAASTLLRHLHHLPGHKDLPGAHATGATRGKESLEAPPDTKRHSTGL